MQDEEEIRPKKHVSVEPKPLDRYDVEDLRGYIESLRAEIARAEAAIRAKQGAQRHAESFFKF